MEQWTEDNSGIRVYNIQIPFQRTKEKEKDMKRMLIVVVAVIILFSSIVFVTGQTPESKVTIEVDADGNIISVCCGKDGKQVPRKNISDPHKGHVIGHGSIGWLKYSEGESHICYTSGSYRWCPSH